jgi:thiol-disulfide isomerase/thioredoxin
LNRHSKKILQLGLLLLIPVWTQAQSPAPAPPLALKDISGHRISLRDYKGKVLLVNFWATWCAPCRKEIPDLIRLQRLYRKQGLQIIGIAYPPQTVREVSRFAKRFKINYPVALGTKATKTSFTPSETLPLTVIIDRAGRVHDVIEGIMYSDEFDQKVKPFLSLPSSTVQRSRKSRFSNAGIIFWRTSVRC